MPAPGEGAARRAPGRGCQAGAAGAGTGTGTGPRPRAADGPGQRIIVDKAASGPRSCSRPGPASRASCSRLPAGDRGGPWRERRRGDEATRASTIAGRIILATGTPAGLPGRDVRGEIIPALEEALVIRIGADAMEAVALALPAPWSRRRRSSRRSRPRACATASMSRPCALRDGRPAPMAAWSSPAAGR